MKHLIACLGIMAVFTASLACGGNYTWTGNADDDWFTAENWDPQQVPGADDNVLIETGATMLLTNQTAALAAFTMTGGTLTFSNWTTRVRADAVTISGGMLTLPQAFTEAGTPNRIWFVVTGDFSLGADALIDADGRGFRNLNGPGKGVRYQNFSVWHWGSGAGHAGRGGRSGSTVLPGAIYGSVTLPVDPGSGGGGEEAGGLGFGGGAVRIEAGGTATIDGTISAQGWPGTGGFNRAGGGSGGSVLIECATFAGAAGGLIRADGGDSSGTHSGGGAGGRIAVHYTTLGNPCAVEFSAIGGVNGWADNTVGALPEHFHYLASWGSLYFPDAQVLETGFAGHRFKADVYIGTAATWNRAALQVAGTTLRLAAPDLTLNLAGHLDVGADGHFSFYGKHLTVGGNATLAGGSDSALFSGANLAGTNYGQRVEVEGTLQVQDGATLWVHSDPVSGGSPLIRADSIQVAANGLISARARGYGGDRGEGAGTQQPTPRAGSGYGGTGGAVNFIQRRGYAYGSIMHPLLPGSGGSSDFGRARAVGGGGLIRLEAADVVIDGLLDADGGGVLAGGGAAAGGAIHITCNRLGGNGGLLSVRGGQGAGVWQGGGGGGRIALHYSELLTTHHLAFRAHPGQGWPDEDPKNRGWIGAAQPGTLFLPDTGLLAANLTDGRFAGIRIHFPETANSWSVPGDLTIRDTWLFVESPNFSLNVGGNLTVDSGGLAGLGEFGVLTVQGDLLLTNSGALRLDAGGEPGDADDWGVLAQVDGTMTVAPGSWVYLHSHPIQGGSPLLRLGGLQVAANAGFNADARGYEHGQGPGAGKRNWTGINAQGMGSGGGHGGRGGDTRFLWSASDPGIGGGVNGLDWLPLWGGSGGYKGTGAPQAPLHPFPGYPGLGGGAIRLDIDGPARIDGTLTAEGFSGIITGLTGGGAGGAIFIRCSDKVMQGDAGAVLSVNGGHGGAGAQRSGGGGGGGRIALWLNAPTESWSEIAAGSFTRYVIGNELPAPFQGTVSWAAGDGYDGWDPNDTGNPAAVGADEGTLVVLTALSPPGTLFMIR